MAKIAVLTDTDFSGSGYFYLMMPLLTGLAKLGHEIKVAGLGYNGSEHAFPFSILPTRDLQDGSAIINNLHFLWNPDIIMVGMDIPIQIQLFQQFSQYKRKYIAITPLENGPLTVSWSANMFNMDAVFFISELGKQEAIKAGLAKAEHLMVGVDTVLWHPANSEEKASLRKGLGIADDEFVIMTVADNQERKNLWAGMEAISRLKTKLPDVKLRYILVTRENSPFGWKLRDLAIGMNLNQELNIFNRGIPVKDLWGLYSVSDVYLQPSKAEGLGMPILEAMACGIPIIATDTGAMHELLFDEKANLKRGYYIKSEYSFVDVWGNSKRDMMDINDAESYLEGLAEIKIKKEQSRSVTEVVNYALQYAKSRTWDIPVEQVDKKIKELLNEPQQAPTSKS